MNLAIAKPVRQFAALGLLAAVVAAIWFAGLAPLADRISRGDEEISGKRLLLGKLQNARAMEAEARELGKRSAALDLPSLLVAGESEPLKAANLQAALAGIAAANGLRFRSTRVLPTRVEDGVQLVAVEASFEASLADIQKMLLTMADHKPMLAVSSLRVSLAPTAALDPESAGSVLEVSMEVAAPAAVAPAAAAPASEKG